LKPILDDYIAFEHRVREQMLVHASPSCGICPAVCCRYDICEESIDSAFLSLIRQHTAPTECFCERYGWLTPTGCALEVGRPPVCYEFLCDDMLHALPNDDARFALRTLGMLITYIGRKAIGTRHLVELLHHEDLLRLHYPRFRVRLQTAQTALEIITDYFDSSTLPDDSKLHLLKICKPGTELYQGP
ncbi:MAG: hypothetical protein PHP44_14955, partial [Kiritimatiellae bacterium]|nr:hypothetical protein [Kiritimatiellia bacterium]